MGTPIPKNLVGSWTANKLHRTFGRDSRLKHYFPFVPPFFIDMNCWLVDYITSNILPQIILPQIFFNPNNIQNKEEEK
jgi:hypothetical protein